MASICLVAEHYKGTLKKTTLNSISFARQAADKTGGELHLLVIGNGVGGVAEALKGFGAVKIHLADDPRLEYYNAETWGHVTTEVARACNASIVCMSAGTTGKDLMPRVSAYLGAGMASGILSFDGDLFTREMWAGNALAKVRINTDIKVVTIQSSAFDTAQAAEAETPVESFDFTIPETNSRVVEMRETKSERPDLTEANIIVTAGRGIKSGENFELVEQLADIFGGAVGATRAAVDAGWVSNTLQVGQTGKVVAPELYVAVGLSGAMQHKAGMKNSRVIVAINKDNEAPIFEISDFGLVADLFDVVPELVEAIKVELDQD